MMAIILTAVAWLLTYLLHSTILIAGATALAALGLVRSAAARDTLWKVALIGGLVTASAQVVLSLQPRAGHLAIASRPESPFVEVAGVRDVAAPHAPAADPRYPAAGRFSDALIGAPAAGAEEPARRSVVALLSNLHIGWPAMLLNLWLVGAFGFLARLGWARLELARRLRDRRPVGRGAMLEMLDELARSAGVRPPRLSVCDEVSGPIAFGGEIVLPERALTHLAPAAQRAVLAHELGHVVRRDPAWLMAALIIESVLFIQPLNRLARRRLRASSEFLCDDWAADRAGSVVLASCLAEVAGWVQHRPAPAAAVGMAGQCSQLVSRVERLLEGGTPSRPGRWVLRAAAGGLALSLVAWSVPGVAAEDLGEDPFALDASADGEPASGSPVIRFAGVAGEETWAQLHDGGRLLVLAPGYSLRLRGQGRLGFREWGRAIAVPEGYEVQVNGASASDEQELCTSWTVRLVEREGDGRWDLVPVRLDGATASAVGAPTPGWRLAASVDRAGEERELARRVDQLASAGLRRAMARVRAAGKESAELDSAVDVALDGEADAAIDTLVHLWVRDPEAVRRAARRIARTYDRELRPQFESLGVEVGRQMAPQLQRLSDRVGRDLAPEFARLGAELGASIVGSLASEVLPPGAGDYRDKRRPKTAGADPRR